MRTFALALAFAAALCAQSPSPAGVYKPETVIAKLPDGREITAAQINEIVRTWPTQFTRDFQADPRRALQQILMIQYLAGEADKRKLADEDPWKGQIEAGREYILAQAMSTWENNHFPVSQQDIAAYYERHKSSYEQSKIKVIMLSFLEPMPTGTAQADVQKAAEIVQRNVHVKTPRTLADAQKLALDIIQQLRAGADFAKLVDQYSDDSSKSNGGDYGTVTPTSNYPPELIKAVFGTSPGNVADPVRLPNALYIVRVEDRTTIPEGQINEQIVAQIRKDHLADFAREIGNRFAPTILHPEFFLPTGDAKPQAPPQVPIPQSKPPQF